MKTSPRLLSTSPAFSILEIMIVVVILGLLSAMGLIAFQHHRSKVMVTAFGSDLRTHRDAIENCLFETKRYDIGAPAGQLSEVLKPYIRNGNWSSATPLGGNWVVDTQLDGIRISVGVDGLKAGTEVVDLADRLLDDGDLSAGQMRLINPGKLIWIIE